MSLLEDEKYDEILNKYVRKHEKFLHEIYTNVSFRPRSARTDSRCST